MLSFESVKSLDSRPSIAITNAPGGAILYVDGELVGEAREYDGKPEVLILERGTHTVTIKAKDGTTLLERTVFVHSELKTIVVN